MFVIFQLRVRKVQQHALSSKGTRDSKSVEFGSKLENRWGVPSTNSLSCALLLTRDRIAVAAFGTRGGSPRNAVINFNAAMIEEKTPCENNVRVYFIQSRLRCCKWSQLPDRRSFFQPSVSAIYSFARFDQQGSETSPIVACVRHPLDHDLELKAIVRCVWLKQRPAPDKLPARITDGHVI